MFRHSYHVYSTSFYDQSWSRVTGLQEEQDKVRMSIFNVSKDKYYKLCDI